MHEFSSETEDSNYGRLLRFSELIMQIVCGMYLHPYIRILYDNSNTTWMNYGVGFIKKHRGKTTASMTTTQSDSIRSISTLIKKYDYKVIDQLQKSKL